ncbi:MAG TPA: hypothetical protein VHZ51_26970 [Ktedonobacteraceae bacterium]|nr:hypothetical protein [Ktedonobacteraceae bacterium]
MANNKPFRLYGRILFLVALSLFVVFTFVYIVVSLNDRNLPARLQAVTSFIASLYPNVFIIPIAFLCSVIFLRPLQQVEQENNEERLLKKIEDRLIPRVDESIMRAQAATISLFQLGVLEIAERFDYPVLGKRIALAEKRILILENWIGQNLYEYEEAFHQAVQKGVSIQVILLNPDSEFTKQRSRDLDHDEQYVPKLIRANITSLKNLRKKLHLKKPQVKYHKSLPSLRIFICDERAIIGFYLHRVDAQYVPQLDILIRNEKQEYTNLASALKLSSILFGNARQMYRTLIDENLIEDVITHRIT